MAKATVYDAVVVGSGPNGLAAGIALARAGRSVLLIEGQGTLGGGVRSAALTLPGFLHDTCSAVHPLGAASPFFRTLPLAQHGLTWVESPAALAHPFDDGSAALLYRSVERTAATLGRDGERYRRLMAPWQTAWAPLFDELLAPLHVPRHPLLMARFGWHAARSATGFARRFREQWARGLFGGLAGHSFLPLTQMPSNAIGMVLAIAAHAVGWPVPKGGAVALTEALTSYFRSLGGEVRTGTWVRSVAELPPSRAVFFDVSPRQLVQLAGDRLPPSYRRSLERYRYGPGVFKIDLALSGPVPWSAPACAEAITVHLGGTLEELVASERAPAAGVVAAKPYVLLAQCAAFDPSRAPAGRHTLWAYCHVPAGSTVDMTARIEAQIERFAPGFRDLVLARHVTSPAAFEAANPNYVGGDIGGGSADLRQLFFRPAARVDPYAVPVRGWYLCSSSTPPGAGVHGMCGLMAVRSALARGLDGG